MVSYQKAMKDLHAANAQLRYMETLIQKIKTVEVHTIASEFTMVVSRLYDPMQVSLQNLSAMLGTSVQSARLDEILSHDIQTGSEELNNDGYDIEFKNVRVDLLYFIKKTRRLWSSRKLFKTKIL